MAAWRFGRGWCEKALKGYLADLAHQPVSFRAPVSEMTPENGWKVDGAEAVLGMEPPGPPVPDGLFQHARQGLINYDFSDPRIVVGHFDPHTPFVGRNMLLEIKVMGLRFLNGVRVHSVCDGSDGRATLFGFRYDTLAGHVESGCEWFLLTKEHSNGQVSFKIEAHWKLGSFPNWWSRLGFRLLGEHYRNRWRDHAPHRLRELARQPHDQPVPPGDLVHRGDPEPQRTDTSAAKDV